MIKSIGGRKYTFGLLCLATSLLVLFLRPTLLREWIDACGVIGGIYVLGNVGADAVAKITPKE